MLLLYIRFGRMRGGTKGEKQYRKKSGQPVVCHATWIKLSGYDYKHPEEFVGGDDSNKPSSKSRLTLAKVTRPLYSFR